MPACTRVLPWVMTECVRVAGLPLLSTSEGILRRTAALYQAFSGARQGWGWRLVAGGGRMVITHRWPPSASNQSHTHLSHGASHKTAGTEGKSIIVPTCLGLNRTNVLLSFKLHFI